MKYQFVRNGLDITYAMGAGTFQAPIIQILSATYNGTMYILPFPPICHKLARSDAASRGLCSREPK